VGNQRYCDELKYAIGYGVSPRRGRTVVVQGSASVGGGYVSGGGDYATGGDYGVYQPQRVIRYVARPSRAAQMQAERRARKAARRAAQNGYGYGDGGMVGYGNGVMVGGYGNNVVINGGAYGGAYAGNGYGRQQVIVQKKRKGKRGRRIVVYQQPGYYAQPGMVYGDYGYDSGYQGPNMYKGGGY
jgi:hypothetical protein